MTLILFTIGLVCSNTVMKIRSWQDKLFVVPACQEDSVLVGAGQFENGRWDWYECGPAVDDFTGD